MKTNSNTQALQRSRAPRGVETARPVAMRLLIEERQELEKLSIQQNRSASSMARIIYLRGVEVMKSSGQL